MDLIGIYNLVETEFKVIKGEKDIIYVAPVSGEDYPEAIVKLTFNEVNNQYELFEIVRGKEYKVDVFSDKYKSALALYIFSKSKLEVRKYDENIQNEIKNATSLTDIQKVFKTFSDEQYYSFYALKPDRIILEKSTNDRYNVLFLGKGDSKIYIDKSRKLNSAAVVLYNFSFKLSQFYDLINMIEVTTDSDFMATLKELYLLG